MAAESASVAFEEACPREAGTGTKSIRAIAKQFAQKSKNESFRGTLRIGEAVFCWMLRKEGLLASFGMTIKGIFPATCKGAIARTNSIAPLPAASGRAFSRIAIFNLLAVNEQRERAWNLRRPWPGIFRRRGWRGAKLRRHGVNVVVPGVEPPGAGSALSGNGVDDCVLVRRIFMRHGDRSIAAGGKCQGRGRIEVAGVDAFADGHAGDHLAVTAS